jgi:hypothetical protein
MTKQKKRGRPAIKNPADSPAKRGRGRPRINAQKTTAPRRPVGRPRSKDLIEAKQERKQAMVQAKQGGMTGGEVLK